VIRAIGYLIAELAWSLVDRLLYKRATWDHEEDDRTTPDAFGEWVGKHKHPPG
jgi:hypothetical protein